MSAIKLALPLHEEFTAIADSVRHTFSQTEGELKVNHLFSMEQQQQKVSAVKGSASSTHCSSRSRGFLSQCSR
jgi:hypothetical protein